MTVGRESAYVNKELNYAEYLLMSVVAGRQIFGGQLEFPPKCTRILEENASVS